MRNTISFETTEAGLARFSMAIPTVKIRCDHLRSVAPRVYIACELLLSVELLVLLLCPPLGNQTGDDCQPASGDDHTTTSLVSWLLRPQEEVGSEPVGYLRTLLDFDAKIVFGGKAYTADTVGNCNKCRSLRSGSRDNCGLPGNLDVQADEGTRAEQEDREVSCSDVECGNHNDSSDQRDENGDDNVPTVLETSSAGP